MSERRIGPRNVPLDDLVPHPLNSNVMSEDLREKLKAHIKRTRRYPFLVVRPFGEKYQVLDGHHRVAILRDLGHTEARCDVWDVDDREAKLLLATLNRLEGQDLNGPCPARALRRAPGLQGLGDRRARFGCGADDHRREWAARGVRGALEAGEGGGHDPVFTGEHSEIGETEWIA